MEKNVRFYICEICGNQIGLIKDNGPKVMCCGKDMTLMQAKEDGDGSNKHLPVCTVDGNEIIVKIGNEPHPMDKDHYIMWVALVGDNRTTRVTLYPEQNAEVIFEYIPNAQIYVYCNKHGLWKLDKIK